MNPLIAVAGLFAALAAVGYVVLCGYIAHRFTRPLRKTKQLGMGDMPLAPHTIHFAARNSRVRIAASYFPAKPRVGAVVLVHGKDACRGDELKAPNALLAEALLRAGLSVLMLDLRGHGASSNARLTYGHNERLDVLGAVDYLLERGYLPGTIGLLGTSMGGSTALLAAADEAAIGAVAADSAFASFDSMVRRHFRKLTGLPLCFLPGALLWARLLCGVNLSRVRPLEAARSLRGRPVMVVHGAHDPFVPAEEGLALANAAGAQIWITNANSHIGSFVEQPALYTSLLGEFFTANLLESRHAMPRRVHYTQASFEPAAFEPQMVAA